MVRRSKLSYAAGPGNGTLRNLHRELGLSLPLSDDAIATFSGVLRELSGKRVVVVAGGMADADSVGSAYAVSQLLGSSAQMAVTTATGAVAKLLIRLGVSAVPLLTALDPSQWDALVLMDCSSSQLVRGIEHWKHKLEVVIDHHTQQHDADLLGRRFTLVMPKIPSTSSMLAMVLPAERITPPMALALASGVMVDTANMTRGGVSSHLTFSYLAHRSGLHPYEILQISFGETDATVRQTVLSSLGVHPETLHGYILARAALARPEGDQRQLAAIVAEFLTGGPASAIPTADVALCTIPVPDPARTEVLRFSVRTSTRVPSTVNMSTVAQTLGEAFGGTGGGHPRQGGGFVLHSTSQEELARSFVRSIESQLALVA